MTEDKKKKTEEEQEEEQVKPKRAKTYGDPIVEMF